MIRLQVPCKWNVSGVTGTRAARGDVHSDVLRHSVRDSPQVRVRSAATQGTAFALARPGLGLRWGR